MREKAGLDLLSTRRENAVKKFAVKCLANPRCENWFKDRGFPSYPRRTGVNYPRFIEESARTDRHRNNPKNYIVRKLNQERD